jgi:hypothetical protein
MRSMRTASSTMRAALLRGRSAAGSRRLSSSSWAWPLSEARGLRISWASTALISPSEARWRARSASRSTAYRRRVDHQTQAASRMMVAPVAAPSG